MSHYDAVKSLILQKLDKRNSDSILWNLSGSTLIHILFILGLGFYIAIPEPVPAKHSISVKLTPSIELSSETHLGKGEKQSTSQEAPHQSKEIIHSDDKKGQFDSGAFQLMSNKLLNEIKEKNDEIAETERIGFLGIYDVHPAYQQYQQYWQSYVSSYGTRNYPQVLLQKGLNGTLELDIAIDKKGVVRSTSIHRSSGNTDIDNAAIEIAMLASPYAPLPEQMANEIDILHIIRTWEFNNQTLINRAKE